jgi:hypothetical protein
MAAFISAEVEGDELLGEFEEGEEGEEEKGFVRAMVLWFWIYALYPICPVFLSEIFPNA